MLHKTNYFMYTFELVFPEDAESQNICVVCCVVHFVVYCHTSMLCTSMKAK